MITAWRLWKSTLRWAVLLLVATSLICPSYAAAQSADGSTKAALSDFKRLEGKWQRPDGGYILELKEIGKDGTVKAAYFNPRPINVARAELKRRDGMLTVLVELRDMNYPGSKYNLQYSDATSGLMAMLCYGLLVTLYLTYLGIRGEWVGLLIVAGGGGPRHIDDPSGSRMAQRSVDQGERHERFYNGVTKESALPRWCKECGVLAACRGGCPKHRFEVTPYSEQGLHYLCRGYKKFFLHIRTYLRAMTQLLEDGLPASYVMDAVKGPLEIRLDDKNGR